jgi:hypothetical protein
VRMSNTVAEIHRENYKRAGQHTLVAGRGGVLRTKFGHVSSSKIHGCDMLHRTEVMRTEMTMNRVDSTNNALEATICRLSGDSRKKRKAMEHFVSHMPIM